MLDVVTYIQRVLDPSLAYRYACRVGMCGSCAMMVNDVPLDVQDSRRQGAHGDRLEIAPLRNLPVIRDLVVDMREFFDKWARAKGDFRGRQTKEDDFAPVPPARSRASRRRRDRMHRLRRVLRRMRRGEVEPRLHSAGGA